MSRIIFRESAAPTTPASGQMTLFADTNGDLSWLDDGGNLTKLVTTGAATITLPNATDTIAVLGTQQTFTARPIFSTTIGVGGVTPSTSGSGISFPATQSPSSDVNTLDDYEEGTWTPDIRSSSGAGTGTYTEQVGTYTRIGRLVMASALVTWTSHTIAVGNLRMGNFPFNPSSSDNMASIGFFSNIGLATNNVATALIPNGSNQMLFYQYPITGGAASLVAMDTAGSIYVSITYTA